MVDLKTFDGVMKIETIFDSHKINMGQFKDLYSMYSELVCDDEDMVGWDKNHIWCLVYFDKGEDYGEFIYTEFSKFLGCARGIEPPPGRYVVKVRPQICASSEASEFMDFKGDDVTILEDRIVGQ